MPKALLFTFALLARIAVADLYPAPTFHFDLDSDFVDAIVGLRPYREGGIRIQRDRRGNVVFIHNYGHGGAGLTLSWGTVEESLRIANGDLRRLGRVAVIGAGVIGLTTANRLRDRGFDVTVYAEHFLPNTTSNVAGGLWSPVSVDMGRSTRAQRRRMQRIQMESYARFLELEQQGWPVHQMPMFVTEEAREKSGLDLFEALPELFSLRKHAVLPIEGVRQGGYEVNTMLIDTPLYLERLMAGARKRGVKFVDKKFDSLADIAEQVGPRSVVFNCTGLGARDLVGDEDVIPVRGDLV